MTTRSNDQSAPREQRGARVGPDPDSRALGLASPRAVIAARHKLLQRHACAHAACFRQHEIERFLMRPFALVIRCTIAVSLVSCTASDNAGPITFAPTTTVYANRTAVGRRRRAAIHRR